MSLFSKWMIRASIAATSAGGGYIVYNKYNPYQENTLIHKRLLTAENAFRQKEAIQSADDIKEVYGRIKAMNPEDSNSFYTLCGAHKPYAFVVGNCGLYNLTQCKTDYDKLIVLGLEKEWIQRKLKQNLTFNLYLFPGKSEEYSVVDASWDGVFQLLSQTQPEIYRKIKKYQDDFKSKSFEEIESECNFKFLDVSQNGRKDPRYMTKERFLEIPDENVSIVDARLLLYCFMNLAKCFSGTGYTVDENGNVGCKEYLITNMKLTDIDHLKCIELNVDIPNNQ